MEAIAERIGEAVFKSRGNSETMHVKKLPRDGTDSERERERESSEQRSTPTPAHRARGLIRL